MIDHDHPGFSDTAYRNRRNNIALSARSHKIGDPVKDVVYTPNEDAVWSYVYQHLSALYFDHACVEYRQAFRRFALTEHRAPQFSEINKKISEVGFTIEPVEGLVDSRRFLSHLADGVMLCTQYIRHHSVPEYTPEPDIIHELFGHAVFFLDPSIRELNRLFGRAAKVCTDEHLVHLERLYWYTIEFGLCLEEGKPKAYGAGLLSSMGELTNINEIDRRPFNIDEIIETPYDTQNQHEKLFCANSFSDAMGQTVEYLNSYIVGR